MRKFFVILAFLSFSINVKADYAPIDIQIAEGEEYQIDQIVAAQVINQTSWDGQYILTGGVARIYIDFLPRQWPDGRQNVLWNGWYVQQQSGGGYWLYHEGFGGANPATITFSSPYDAYQWLISPDGVRYCGEWMTTQDDEDGLGEYLDTSTMSYVGIRNSSSSDEANWVLEHNQQALATLQNRQQFLLETDILSYSQVPINGVKITVTNSTGQTVNQIDYTQYLLDIQSLINQVISRLGRINSDTSASVAALQYLINALGFSNDPANESLYEMLGQWRTTDGINQGEILNVLTNLTDYTDYWKKFSSYQNPTNVSSLVWLLNKWATYPSSIQSGLINRNQLNAWLGRDFYDAYRNYLRDQYSEFLSSDSSQMNYLISYLPRYEYLYEGVEFNKWTNQTNIVDAVTLGRDWLNLATNDLNSFTYWLNQQTLVQNGTNGASSAQQKFDAITNQYSQISLVGANASNSAQNWDYFKRLEMLLAALVYKQTDYEGTIDSHESCNNASVSSSVASGEDQINTSLTAVKDALTLSTIGNAKNTIVSLFQTATSAFDVNGSKRVINVFETDAAGGNDGASVTVNLDFTQGELGDFADFVHHLFGFLWGFGSLFIFWRVCKFCWDMGYKVVKFHYSLCRKFLGI